MLLVIDIRIDLSQIGLYVYKYDFHWVTTLPPTLTIVSSLEGISLLSI